MAIKSKVLSETIKKKGLWNFKEFYNFCFEWFQSEGYILTESKYQDKMQEAGQEIVIEWLGWRKITDYFKFEIKVEWHILGMKTEEAEREGKKVKTNKGELEVKVTGQLVRDYENRWELKPFWKFLRGVYERYVIRTTVDEYEDRLIEDTLKFIGQVKSFLELN